MSKLITVNYHINRPKPPLGRTIEHEEGSMTVEGERDEATEDKINQLIMEKHPGWKVTGWAWRF